MFNTFCIMCDNNIFSFLDDNVWLWSNSRYAAEGFSSKRRESWNIPLPCQCESVSCQAQHHLHYRKTSSRHQMRWLAGCESHFSSLRQVPHLWSRYGTLTDWGETWYELLVSIVIPGYMWRVCIFKYTFEQNKFISLVQGRKYNWNFNFVKWRNNITFSKLLLNWNLC